MCMTWIYELKQLFVNVCDFDLLYINYQLGALIIIYS